LVGCISRIDHCVAGSCRTSSSARNAPTETSSIHLRNPSTAIGTLPSTFGPRHWINHRTVSDSFPLFFLFPAHLRLLLAALNRAFITRQTKKFELGQIFKNFISRADASRDRVLHTDGIIVFPQAPTTPFRALETRSTLGATGLWLMSPPPTFGLNIPSHHPPLPVTATRYRV